AHVDTASQSRSLHDALPILEGKPKGDEQLYALGATVNVGLSEYMVLNESATVLSPETYTDNQASTLPVAAFVVWFSLVEYGNIRSEAHTSELQSRFDIVCCL